MERKKPRSMDWFITSENFGTAQTGAAAAHPVGAEEHGAEEAAVDGGLVHHERVLLVVPAVARDRHDRVLPGRQLPAREHPRHVNAALSPKLPALFSHSMVGFCAGALGHPGNTGLALDNDAKAVRLKINSMRCT